MQHYVLLMHQNKSPIVCNGDLDTAYNTTGSKLSAETAALAVPISDSQGCRLRLDQLPICRCYDGYEPGSRIEDDTSLWSQHT